MMVIICHEMKWDYFTYLEQPEWFVKAINSKMNIENYHKNKINKKLNKN